MAYYDDLTYKRDEIKEFLDERIEEMKEYDIKNLKQLIKEYEEDNFGEVTTELDNPEKVVNMYVYIVGEDLINEGSIDKNLYYENQN